MDGFFSRHADAALSALETALNDPSVSLTVKRKAATIVLDRVGLNERNGTKQREASQEAERKQTEYFSRLEDPMDPLHLLEGFGS